MKQSLLPLLFLLMLSLPSHGQVDTVIIATDMTSVDALVAKAAGDKSGAPVLVTEDGLLNDDIKSQLSSLSIKTVVLVGGPSVISPAVADELRSLGYEVVRLWGFERTGTAIEVARYFWPEGVNCSILVDDTKNSSSDTDLQNSASLLASELKCPVMPIPAALLPAKVLKLLGNASELKIVAKAFPNTGKLFKLKYKVIAGTKGDIDDEVEEEIESLAKQEGEKLKLVIVATPSWKHALSASMHPAENSVVKFVSNISQVADIIAKIKEKNITDVKVVGIPSLAQDIAQELTDANITPKVVSGQKITAIQKKGMEDFKEKWSEKKKKFKEAHLVQLARIKERLLDRLNETEKDLAEQEIEMESLKAEGGDAAKIAEIDALISEANLTAIRASILSNNVDDANKHLARLLAAILERKWLHRASIKLNVQEDVEEEEDTSEVKESKAQRRIATVEARFATLRERCGNITAVEELVTKARSLLEEAAKAVQGGDHASRNFTEARRLAESAHRLSNICEKEMKISERLRKAAEKLLGESLGEGSGAKTVKEFNMTLFHTSIDPATISAGKGDTIRILAVTGTGTTSHNHGITIDEYGINTAVITEANPTKIEFVADKAGTFTIYCKPCWDGPFGTGHPAIKATLVVQ